MISRTSFAHDSHDCGLPPLDPEGQPGGAPPPAGGVAPLADDVSTEDPFKKLKMLQMLTTTNKEVYSFITKQLHTFIIVSITIIVNPFIPNQRYT